MAYLPMPETDDRSYNSNFYSIFGEDGSGDLTGLNDQESKFSPSKVSMKEFLVGYLGSHVHSLTLSSSTESRGQVGVSRIVSNIVGSESAPKDSLLQNVNDYWPLSETCSHFIDSLKGSGYRFTPFDFADICLVYPVLQPYATKIKLSNLKIRNKDKSLNNFKGCKPYLPWEFNSAEIKLTLSNENNATFIDNVSEEHVKVSLGDLFLAGDSRLISAGNIHSEEGICISCSLAASWEQLKAKVINNFLFRLF